MKTRNLMKAAVCTAMLVPAVSFAQEQHEDTQRHDAQQRLEQQQETQRQSERSSQQDYERGRMSGSESQAQEPEVETTLSASVQAFRRVTEQTEIPQEVQQNAKCVAVFPEVTRAAVLVGGRAGDGVATCKNDQGQWSRPAPVDLTGASFGAQLGATQTSLVMFFQNEEAVRRLQQGNFTFSGDVNAVIGDRTAGMNAEMGQADVVALTEERGAFAGAALNGVQIEVDEDKVRSYYGSDVQASNILKEHDQQKAQEKQGAKQFLSAVKEKLQSAQG